MSKRSGDEVFPTAPRARPVAEAPPPEPPGMATPNAMLEEATAETAMIDMMSHFTTAIVEAVRPQPSPPHPGVDLASSFRRPGDDRGVQALDPPRPAPDRRVKPRLLEVPVARRARVTDDRVYWEKADGAPGGTRSYSRGDVVHSIGDPWEERAPSIPRPTNPASSKGDHPYPTGYHSRMSKYVPEPVIQEWVEARRAEWLPTKWVAIVFRPLISNVAPVGGRMIEDPCGAVLELAESEADRYIREGIAVEVATESVPGGDRRRPSEPLTALAKDKTPMAKWPNARRLHHHPYSDLQAAREAIEAQPWLEVNVGNPDGQPSSDWEFPGRRHVREAAAILGYFAGRCTFIAGDFKQKLSPAGRKHLEACERFYRSRRGTTALPPAYDDDE